MYKVKVITGNNEGPLSIIKFSDGEITTRVHVEDFILDDQPEVLLPKDKCKYPNEYNYYTEEVTSYIAEAILIKYCESLIDHVDFDLENAELIQEIANWLDMGFFKMDKYDILEIIILTIRKIIYVFNKNIKNKDYYLIFKNKECLIKE